MRGCGRLPAHGLVARRCAPFVEPAVESIASATRTGSAPTPLERLPIRTPVELQAHTPGAVRICEPLALYLGDRSLPQHGLLEAPNRCFWPQSARSWNNPKSDRALAVLDQPGPNDSSAAIAVRLLPTELGALKPVRRNSRRARREGIHAAFSGGGTDFKGGAPTPPPPQKNKNESRKG